MSINQLEKFLDKFTEVTKPKDVIKLEYKLDPAGKGQYFLHLDYIVSDESPYLKIKRGYMEDPRTEWNEQIKKTLESYLDIKFYITSTSMRSESYYKHMKEIQKT